MIELSRMSIHHYNDVIEARKKIYCLAQDLFLNSNDATYFAILASELLHALLVEQKSADLKLAFTKTGGYYHLNVFISSTEPTYHLLKKAAIFHDMHYRLLDNQQLYLELSIKITDLTFVPDEHFLQTERERLIQQSSGEMLQEIRQKNIELNKALQDLKTSSEMIQTEKMRALGSMTAGVAHELNNPMMGILNFIQYAIKHTKEDDRRYEPLVDAEREVRRCQDIITNLLTFSRVKAEGEEEFSLIKPSVLFDRIVQLHTYKLRSTNIHVNKHYPKDEAAVRMKVNKMQQVILNLVTNAIDAMKDCEKKELTLIVDIGKENVTLGVYDTGPGIDEETLDKIFEPFFTTKKAGQGTGLGLAVSRSIIEEHRGVLNCQSKVGEGARFIVTLPIHQQTHE